GSHSVFSAMTDANGDFSFSLSPGEYILRVNAEGFAEVSRTVKVKSNTSQSLEILVEIASSTATVTIMGADTVGYRVPEVSSATKISTPLRDVPQSITVVTKEQMR